MIPKQFTDEYLIHEKESLEDQINSRWHEVLTELSEKASKLERSAFRNNIGAESSRVNAIPGNEDFQARFREYREYRRAANEDHSESIRLKKIYDDILLAGTDSSYFNDDTKVSRLKKELRDVEWLLSKTPNARVEDHYQSLVTEKDRSSTEERYFDLAAKFRQLESYKDSATLAEECIEKKKTLKEQREEQERIRKEEQKIREEEQRIQEEESKYLQKCQLQQRQITEKAIIAVNVGLFALYPWVFPLLDSLGVVATGWRMFCMLIVVPFIVGLIWAWIERESSIKISMRAGCLSVLFVVVSFVPCLFAALIFGESFATILWSIGFGCGGFLFGKSIVEYRL